MTDGELAQVLDRIEGLLYKPVPASDVDMFVAFLRLAKSATDEDESGYHYYTRSEVNPPFDESRLNRALEAAEKMMNAYWAARKK